MAEPSDTFLFEKASLIKTNLTYFYKNIPKRTKRLATHFTKGYSSFKVTNTSWMWGNIKKGLLWLGHLSLHLLDLIGCGEVLQILWGLVFKLRKLTPAEIEASRLVHPNGMIPYDLVRVDENSLLSKISGGAVATFHILHYPKRGIPLDVVVHELTHVAQYEKMGSVYMPQALHVLVKHGRVGGRGSGSAYDYERMGTLTDLCAAGTRFQDLNCESQAQLVQDYYLALTRGAAHRCKDMIPFIEEMQEAR